MAMRAEAEFIKGKVSNRNQQMAEYILLWSPAISITLIQRFSTPSSCLTPEFKYGNYNLANKRDKGDKTQL